MTTPLILKAKPVAEALFQSMKEQVCAFEKITRGERPCLATVLVGEDPGSQIYVKNKGQKCVELGMHHLDHKLSSTTTQSDLIALIKKLNADNNIHGILVQRPLPAQLNETEIFDLIDYRKDVDCFSPTNVGLLSQGRARFRPCTPAGMMELLRYYSISVSGKNALVLGRSDIVGKPMAMMLTQSDATVTVAHSKTSDLRLLISQADIIVAAIGKSHYLSDNFTYKPGCIILDVGINRLSSGKVVGDVDFEKIQSKVAALTPVPGGVGPMTISMLMVNTIHAAYALKGLPVQNKII